MKNSMVIFNDVGRSIESACYIFKDKKWREGYLLCSQPNDVRNVVLYVYKNHKYRLKEKESSALTLDTYVGMESGFDLRKKRHTLCAITRNEMVIVAFSTSEDLILWESWLNQTCARGSMFFAQLVSAPETSRAYSAINREVRVHIHDGRFALVYGRPQRLIGYWLISDIVRIGFADNGMHFFAHDRLGLDFGTFSLICGQIEQLEKHFTMAKKPGLLLAYLDRKSGDGSWLERSHSLFACGHSSLHGCTRSLHCHGGSCDLYNSNANTPCNFKSTHQLWEPQSEVHLPLSYTHSTSSGFDADFVINCNEIKGSLCRFNTPKEGPFSSAFGGVAEAKSSTINVPEGCLNRLYENTANQSMSIQRQQSNTNETRFGNNAHNRVSVRHNSYGGPLYVNVVNKPSKRNLSVPSLACCSAQNYVNVKERDNCSVSLEQSMNGSISCNGLLSKSISGSRANARSELSVILGSGESHAVPDERISAHKQNSLSLTSSSTKPHVFRTGSWPKHIYNDAYMEGNKKRHMSLFNVKMCELQYQSEGCNARSLNSTIADESCVQSQKTSPLLRAEPKGKYVRQHQRLTRARGRDAASIREGKNMGTLHPRSRSVGLEATVKRSGSTREENWDRAKRIIGGARRSTNGSRAGQSSSLDKLVSSPTGLLRSGGSHCNFVLESLPTADAEKVPRLDLDVNVDTCTGASTSTQNISAIPGLVKLPPEKFSLKRAGNIFTKSLRKSVTGSYSKYDGERTTHHYNMEDTKDLPLAAPVADCIESAVKKGRARLIEADRRNSSFADGLHSITRSPLMRTTKDPAMNFLQPSDIGVLQDVCGDPSAAPPPLPPRTYKRIKERIAATTSVDGKEMSKITDTLKAEAITGNYSDLVPSAAPSRKQSSDISRMHYALIDPVATTAACKVQAEMMRERELRCKTNPARMTEKTGSARAISSRKKLRRKSEEVSATNASRGFFTRHLFKKPSPSLSHSDLTF